MIGKKNKALLFTFFVYTMSKAPRVELKAEEKWSWEGEVTERVRDSPGFDWSTRLLLAVPRQGLSYCSVFVLAAALCVPVKPRDEQ